MRAILWLVKERIIIWKNHPWQVLFLLAVPFLSVVLYLYTSTGTSQDNLTLGVVDHDRTATSHLLVQGMRRRTTVKMLTHEQEAKALSQQNVMAIVTIPTDYQQRMDKGERPALTLRALQQGTLINNLRDSVTASVTDTLQVRGLATRSVPIKQVGTYLETHTPQLKFRQIDQHVASHTLTLQIIGFLLMMMLYQANTFGTRSLQLERRNKIYQRTMLTPISPASYFGGTALFGLLAMLVEVVLTVIVMVGIFKISIGMSVLTLMGVLLWFGILAVLWSLAVGVLANSSGLANGLQVLLITLSSLLSGALIPISVMPTVMQRVAMITPQYWLLQALTQLQLGTVTGKFWESLAMVGLFSLLCFSLAIFGFMRRQRQEIFD
ncbi:ABC transporter permease [Lactiplantibacillus xiangfangensis]|uniref:ABC transporter permease n=1 Tax=Lactiplantibacillus xiangfangensis TaxID=942150 RepID=A0A0R2M355_9LACO|nr:ABC transporter permease [Lactiplantibacillus xiangfangensis]KRO07911.1 ABC transporter permease [Lactiplantibacillus xiangfangensis]